MSRFAGLFHRNHDADSGENTYWFQRYAVTDDDTEFMSGLRGRTLLPTSVQLPSGRTATGAELREWLDHHSAA